MTAISAEALTTVADVKELLGIAAGVTTKDNLITRNINYATKIILNYTGRDSFKSTAYTEYYDGLGGNELTLRHYPVIAFTSIGYKTGGGNVGTYNDLDSVDYFNDNDAGIVKSLIALTSGFNDWKVVYTAGYANVPDDVAEACARMAAYMTENGTAGTNVKKKQEGQRSVEYFDSSGGNGSIIESLGLDDILASYCDVRISGDN